MVVGGRELIDTLWNVNQKYFLSKEQTEKELIDTLWNVNTVTVTSVEGLMGN